MNWFVWANAILRQWFYGRVVYTEEEQLSIRVQCNPCPIMKAVILNDPKKLKKALLKTPNVAAKLQQEWPYCHVYFDTCYYGGVATCQQTMMNLVDELIERTDGEKLQCILLLLEFGGKFDNQTKQFLVYHYELLQIYLVGSVCNADMFSDIISHSYFYSSPRTCNRYKTSKNILEMWPITMLIYCLHYKNCYYFL